VGADDDKTIHTWIKVIGDRPRFSKIIKNQQHKY